MRVYIHSLGIGLTEQEKARKPDFPGSILEIFIFLSCLSRI